MKVYTVDLWTDKPPGGVPKEIRDRVTGEYFRAMVMVADGAERREVVDAAMKGAGVTSAEARHVEELFLPRTVVLGRWFTED